MFSAFSGGKAESASPPDVAFSALSRADVAAPDEAFVSALVNGLPPSTRIDAARVRLARRADGADIYIASGPEALCLASERAATAGVSRSFACGLLDDLASGDKAIVGVETSPDTGGVRITALLPDGVSQVRFISGDQQIDLPVVNNVATAVVASEPDSLVWTTPAGSSATQDLRVLDPTRSETE